MKLEGANLFWMIDYAAIDYTRDLDVNVSALSLSSVITETGEDVKDVLKYSDDSYYLVPEPGNRAILRYVAHAMQKGIPDLPTLISLIPYMDKLLHFSKNEYHRILKTVIAE